MITNDLLLKKIKEQINEAEQVVDDSLLFKEVLKRVELLCELVTEDTSNTQLTPKIMPEQLLPATQKNKTHSLETTNKQSSTNLSSDSIFDF